MPGGAADAPYSRKRVQEMLGLSGAVLSSLVKAGFVTPARGARNEHRFSLRDLMLLRTAHALHVAGVQPAGIVRALSQLRRALPAELPLTGLRITALGSKVTVTDRRGRWEAESGQALIDFEVAEVAGEVAFLAPPAAAAPPPATAADWFGRGQQAEAHDRAGAEDAYRRAIALAPTQADAYLNLGVLLCDSQRCDDAVALYDLALERGADTALIHFNRAIALEDQGRADAALASYERCLQRDGSLADAHYNAGRLLEQRGDSQGALRHFSAYRRLQRAGPG